MKFRPLRAVVPALALLAFAVPALALDTLWVVRHAEKAGDWPSTREMNAFHPLSESGIARSRRLAERLSEVDLKVIVGSPTTRTLHTGLAAAAEQGCELRVDRNTIDPNAIGAWLEALREEFPGAGAALVVGHSNTVPWFLSAAGAGDECWERLGVSGNEDAQLVEGYSGLWEIKLDAEGCAAILRHDLP